MNDLVPPDNLAYLLRHDTAYGRYNRSVEAEDDKLIIDGQTYPVFSEKDPAQLPWNNLKVDVVLECTGVFTKTRWSGKAPAGRCQAGGTVSPRQK